ncbi:MAG: glycosyltransferase family 4 protein [Patescibacteria group bacterium]|nr:glycosyltransferase family 4 protein [Patescibacteria group bacterium]
MKILLVASFFPYPLYSGGQVRLFNLLRNLGKKHEITLVCENRGKIIEKDWNAVKKYCRNIYTVNRPAQWSLTNIIKTGLSPYPFLLTGHKNKQMTELIRAELNKEEYDLVHVETFYVMHNLPSGIKIPVVLTEHNTEWKIYKTWTDRFWFMPLRPLFYYDVLKLRFWEEYFWKKADKLLAVSDIDKKEMEKKRKQKVELIPNGVDCDYFSKIAKIEPEAPTVLFVGSFKWLQNRDAVSYLLTKLWPEIKKKVKNSRLWIIGNNSLKFVRQNGDGITIEEGVIDIRKVYSSASLLLAPIRIGGGTKFKILESMAAGLPIVTTSKGVEGLGSDTNGIIVKDAEEELIDKAVCLLKDETARKEISNKEKKFVKKFFDWKDISQKLEDIYLLNN